MLVGVVVSIEQFPWRIEGGSSPDEYSLDAMGICHVELAETIAEVIFLPDFMRLRDTARALKGPKPIAPAAK